MLLWLSRTLIKEIHLGLIHELCLITLDDRHIFNCFLVHLLLDQISHHTLIKQCISHILLLLSQPTRLLLHFHLLTLPLLLICIAQAHQQVSRRCGHCICTRLWCMFRLRLLAFFSLLLLLLLLFLINDNCFSEFCIETRRGCMGTHLVRWIELERLLGSLNYHTVTVTISTL